MNVYEVITNKVIEKLEQGIVPWHKNWSTRAAVSHETGKPYSFLNQILLDGFGGGEWLTFNQVKKEGGTVKKGEKGSIVMFFTWKEEIAEDKDGNVIKEPDGKDKIVQRPIPKYYYVFEVGQCEGIERKYPIPERRPHNNIKEAEEVISNYLENNPELKFELSQQNKSYYSPSEDKILLPEKEQFKTIDDYYSTAFHEMVHSTMNENRLDRREGRFNSFGSKEYAKEELVAEMGSCYLCDYTGISSTFDNSTAYIKSWLKRLKNDSKFIVSASSKAEKAVGYILKKDTVENVA